MTESDRLIDEVLRLDESATKGPWKSIRQVHYVHGPDCRVAQCGDYKDKELEEFNGDRWQRDANLIASYRSAAPRLARMLQVALTALSWFDVGVGGAHDALAEIERIAKGESNGD